MNDDDLPPSGMIYIRGGGIISPPLPPLQEPVIVIINLDTYWGGRGFKEVKVTCNGIVYVLSKQQIEDFLKRVAPTDGQ